MDELAGLLDGPRARRAFVLRSVFEPPWSLLIRDEAPLSIVAVTDGTAWIAHPERRARLGPGDVALVRGEAPYVVADDPATEPQVAVEPGQACTSLTGDPIEWLGARTWGNPAGGSTRMVCGTYQHPGEVGGPLLRALPAVAVVPAADGPSELLHLLADELARDEPGQSAVLDRLLDLLLVATLRRWFARPEADAPGWFVARADPLVGAALGLLDDRPAEPWTVASLAREVGASRAALARRFTELVGEPPMTYLTRRRLALAADLLREPGTTVAAVAAQVGYGTPFALSAAFKRERGCSPAAYRKTASAAP